VPGAADGALDQRRVSVVETLGSLFAERGAPSFIHSDNGPEFMAKAVKRWLASSGVETLYIEPGAPRENAYIRRRS
jgi:putative transposase